MEELLEPNFPFIYKFSLSFINPEIPILRWISLLTAKHISLIIRRSVIQTRRHRGWGVTGDRARKPPSVRGGIGKVGGGVGVVLLVQGGYYATPPFTCDVISPSHELGQCTTPFPFCQPNTKTTPRLGPTPHSVNSPPSGHEIISLPNP